MLRSIFSLIQNIIDSDKEYNNRKSSTTIYLVSSAPDNDIKMDLEIDGSARQDQKHIKDNETCGSFKITTEQGDTVTCRHFTDQQIKPKNGKVMDENLREEYAENVERIGERTSFINDEEIVERQIVDENTDKLEEPEKNPCAQVNELLAKYPKKQIKGYQGDKDQIAALMEQIHKMKTGMERLQEIAQQFNCSERFKEDVDALIKNGSKFDKSEAEVKNLTPKPI